MRSCFEGEGEGRGRGDSQWQHGTFLTGDQRRRKKGEEGGGSCACARKTATRFPKQNGKEKEKKKKTGKFWFSSFFFCLSRFFSLLCFALLFEVRHSPLFFDPISLHLHCFTSLTNRALQDVCHPHLHRRCFDRRRGLHRLLQGKYRLAHCRRYLCRCPGVWSHQDPNSQWLSHRRGSVLSPSTSEKKKKTKVLTFVCCSCLVGSRAVHGLQIHQQSQVHACWTCYRPLSPSCCLQRISTCLKKKKKNGCLCVSLDRC